MQHRPRFVPSGIESLTAVSFRHDLAESVGPDLVLGQLLEEDLPRELLLGYGSTPGDATLRAALAQPLGAAPDDVLVTPGGMHALFIAALVTCESGDRVTLETPAFPNTRACLEALRLDVRDCPLRFDNGYRHDLDLLASMLNDELRLLVLTSPQNPSGVALQDNELEDILELVETHAPRACVLIDETYRQASYGNDPVVPSAFGRSERVMVCGSLSKCHGAPGLRVGWIATTNERLREQLTLAKFNTVISLSRVDEWLATRVLERAPQILAERQAHLARCLESVEAWIDARGEQLSWVRPDAGALCCIRLSQQRFDADALGRFHRAAAEREVRVAPGPWFGDEPNVCRLGFGLHAAPALSQALAALGEAIDATDR